MRSIPLHQVNFCNQQIDIQALYEVGRGGAPASYKLTGFSYSLNPYYISGQDIGPPWSPLVLVFQEGNPTEVGVNGITHEALLAVLIDRLQSFQQGPFACPQNEEALQHLSEAMRALNSRTQERMARGVEGTGLV